jgi:hypothetical protein
MDVSLQSRAEQLANEFASQATTIEELDELMRLMMKSGLERMLDTEMDVHLCRLPLASIGRLLRTCSYSIPALLSIADSLTPYSRQNSASSTTSMRRSPDSNAPS